MSEGATLELTAPFLLRGHLRRELEAAKFRGARIDWIEQKQFLESRFVIRGEVALLRAIGRAIDRYNAEAA